MDLDSPCHHPAPRGRINEVALQLPELLHTPGARAVSTSSPGPLNRWKLLEALRSADEGARAVDGVDWMLGARLKW